MTEKLIMRRVTADQTVVLLVRRDATSPWIELYRASQRDHFALAILDQKQRVFMSHEIVREVFFDIIDEGTPLADYPKPVSPVPGLIRW